MMKAKFRNCIGVLGALCFVACTESGSSKSSTPAIHYEYGHSVLPGQLADLVTNYNPENLSPKVFSSLGKNYAPMNFKQQRLHWTFDLATQKALGHAEITFDLSQESYPYFQLAPSIGHIQLDGVTVTTLPLTDPDGQGSKYVTLNQSVSPGQHALEMDYELNISSLAFRNGGVALLTDMSDLAESNYFESWAPTSFEDDPFQLILNIQVLNSSSPHEIFTNGALQKLGAAEWEITFPNYFTTSSFYVHLTNSVFLTKELKIQGQQKSIPVTLYAKEQGLINEAEKLLPGLFQELEGDYGPYAHDRFVAYLQNGGGGMEYSGATITSIGALDHELFHSWFARGVMPAEGRSGWIDEAFASWRDYGYFQAPTLLSRPPTKLSAFSPYRQSTPDNCYKDGRQLVAELDRVFAEYGGMKPLMKSFFARYNHRVVTNEELWKFLSSMTMINVDLYFQRYTLAQAVPASGQAIVIEEASIGETAPSKHPRPLTRKEVESLR